MRTTSAEWRLSRAIVATKVGNALKYKRITSVGATQAIPSGISVMAMPGEKGRVSSAFATERCT
jgi:urease beta subunit